MKEAVRMGNYGQAAELKREREGVGFQLLQIRPVIQEMRSKEEEQRQRKQEFEQDRQYGYKERVREIQEGFMQVQELIDMIAPKDQNDEASQQKDNRLSRNSAAKDYQLDVSLSNSRLDQVSTTFETTLPTTEDRQELQLKYRRYKPLLGKATLLVI